MRSWLLFSLLLYSGLTCLEKGRLNAAVVLNEVMSSNGSTLADQHGDYEDWIELYNTGTEAVPLLGYGLSDNPSRPFKWVFPDLTIAPGGFLLVFASGKDLPAHPPHTNFKIDSAGETLVLSAPDGTLLDQFEGRVIPRDYSSGRQPDGTGDWKFYATPTPGKSNTGPGVIRLLEPPAFSHPGGFYEEGFLLELSSDEERAVIYYTLDGSAPDKHSPVYSSPIPVTSRTGEANQHSEIRTGPDPFGTRYNWHPPAGEVFKATVIRAVSIKDGFPPTDAVAHTYFVGPQAQSRYSLPVISLAANSEHFFDEQTGIYVTGPGDPQNYTHRGREWERPVHLEFFDEHRNRAFSQELGARVHGGWTRHLPMKSLRFYARSEYGGRNTFDYPLFPELGFESFKTFVLRNSGNDFIGVHFRDGLTQALARELGLEAQAYRPAVVFLNGEYWGIHNIRERLDEYFLENHFGQDPEQVDLLAGRWGIEAGDWWDYLALLAHLGEWDGREHQPRRLPDGTYQIALDEHYAQAGAMMDIPNFIRYQILQIYICNTDWPQNNIRFWRPQREDGKWRWIVFDTDFAFGFHVWEFPAELAHTHDTLAWAANPRGYPYAPWSTFILRTLLENPSFRQEFINTFAGLLNTALHPDAVIARINRIQALLEPDIEEHIHRWRYPAPSVAQWRQKIEQMRTFARERPRWLQQHFTNFFGLQGVQSLSLVPSLPYAGKFRINGFEVSPGREAWTGVFFNSIPLQITALAQPGYEFVRWEGELPNLGRPLLTVSLTDDLALTAVFQPSDPFRFPVPHALASGPYTLTEWSSGQQGGAYPPHMVFAQTSQPDPGLEAELKGPWNHPYNLTSRSRINGLGPDGFSFVNTGNPQDEQSGYLSAALLALDTAGVDSVWVHWTGGTVMPNSRTYAVRLQYRIGNDGPFQDVPGLEGNPVEYIRHPLPGHHVRFGPIRLPEETANQPLLQLCWRYHYIDTGVSGSRAELRVDNILVASAPLDDLIEMRIESAERTGGDALTLRAAGPEGALGILESSFDLQIWFPVTTNQFSAEGAMFNDDSLDSASSRFYRLRLHTGASQLAK